MGDWRGCRPESANGFWHFEMVVIRRAQIEDASAIAQVRAESWRAAHRGIVPDEYLDSIDVSEWAERQSRVMEYQPAELVSLVAEADQSIVGITAAGPNRDADTPYSAELYIIYLLPDYWRRGIGGKLMCATARLLVSQGLNSMILWVLAENWPARRFYEALGGRYVAQRTIGIAGAELPEVAYGWSDTGVLAELANGEPSE